MRVAQVILVSFSANNEPKRDSTEEQQRQEVTGDGCQLPLGAEQNNPSRDSIGDRVKQNVRLYLRLKLHFKYFNPTNQLNILQKRQRSNVNYVESDSDDSDVVFLGIVNKAQKLDHDDAVLHDYDNCLPSSLSSSPSRAGEPTQNSISWLDNVPNLPQYNPVVRLERVIRIIYYAINFHQVINICFTCRLLCHPTTSNPTNLLSCHRKENKMALGRGTTHPCH